MPRILTVDDSRAIRMIVSKIAQEMGLEIEEAEDGEQGLARLEEVEYDLILLDVTMPVLDGPGMLAKMREIGNTTPVLMLTSESKRSIIAELMKLKIEDYILKPFKNEEIKEKIVRILKRKDPNILDTLSAQVHAVMTPAAPVFEAAAPAAVPGRQFSDILVIDDMDNVHKKLRSLVPAHLSLASATNGQSGIRLCRERTFRLILVDHELPDTQGAMLVKQLRILQPSAASIAMALKTSNDLAAEVKEEGFDDILYKPFTPDAVEELLQRFFESQELVTREDNILSVGSFSGRQDRLDRYFTRLAPLVKAAIQEVAEACFETVILDGAKLPDEAARTAQLVQEAAGHAKKFGLRLCLVGSQTVAKSLKAFTETADIPVLSTLEEARAAAA